MDSASLNDIGWIIVRMSMMLGWLHCLKIESSRRERLRSITPELRMSEMCLMATISLFVHIVDVIEMSLVYSVWNDDDKFGAYFVVFVVISTITSMFSSKLSIVLIFDYFYSK